MARRYTRTYPGRCYADAGKRSGRRTSPKWASLGPTTFFQTAKLLMETTGRQVPIRCEEARLRPEKSEVSRLLADNRKMTDLTGWLSEVSFPEVGRAPWTGSCAT